MEQKKAKLISCTFAREWAGPKGQIYYFNLEWDNGDKGEMSTNRIKETGNKRYQTKFVIGSEQEYTVLPKFNKQTGSEYLFFDKPKEPFVPNKGGNGYRQNDPLKQRRIAKSVALKASIQLKSFTKSTIRLSETSDVILKWIDEYSQGEESKHISAQTAVNATILYIETLEQQERETYLNMEKFLKNCKIFADYIVE